MSAPKLAIVIGHSHTGAITHALTHRDLSATDARSPLHIGLYEAWKFNGDPPFMTKGEDGSDRFNPAIVAAAEALEASRSQASYFTLFGGNAHSVIALLRHPRSFDFVLAEAPDLPLDPDCEIVPSAYLEAVLQGLMHPFLYQLYHLKCATRAPVLAFEAPPVNPDPAYLAPRLDAFFTQTEGPRTIAPKSVRLKARLLQTRLLARLCANNNITLIPSPAEAIDSEGFLTRDCYGEDATHASEAYGELLLRQIETIMGAQIRSWSSFS